MASAVVDRPTPAAAAAAAATAAALVNPHPRAGPPV